MPRPSSFPFILQAGPQNQPLAKAELELRQELFKEIYIFCLAGLWEKHGDKENVPVGGRKMTLCSQTEPEPRTEIEARKHLT